MAAAILKKHAHKLALAAALAVIPGTLLAMVLGLLSGKIVYALLFVGITVYTYAGAWALRNLLDWRPPGEDRLFWGAFKAASFLLLFLDISWLAALALKPASTSINPLHWALPFINFVASWVLAGYYLMHYSQKRRKP